MDACIKGVDESAWRTFKVESTKNGLRMGEMFNKIVDEHAAKSRKGNARRILFRKKVLKGLVTREDFKKIRADFRKNFKMREF